MSFCLPPPRTTWVLGLESIVSYDHSNTSFTLGLVVIGVLLILEAAVLVYYPGAFYRGISVLSGSGYPSDKDGDILNRRSHTAITMRWIIAGYTFITGIFAWLRAIFDTGKPLLIGAALHNLAEFCILVHLYYSYKNVNKYLRVAIVVVAAVITAVIISPSFAAAVFIEQQFGVLFDYSLFLTFLNHYFQTTSSENHSKDPTYNRVFVNLWHNGLIGSATHFGQIWTLILGALGVGAGTWIQSAIEGTLYFSAPITFLYYGWFAMEWDRLVDTDANEFFRNYSINAAENGDYSSINHGSKEEEEEDSYSSSSSSYPNPKKDDTIFTPNSPLLTKDADIIKIWRRLTLSVILAVATIVGPALVPRCPASPSSSSSSPVSISNSGSSSSFTVVAAPVTIPGAYCAETDGSLSGFTLIAAKNTIDFPALLDAMSPLVAASRADPGNIHYDLLQHVDGIHLTFYEKWASKDLMLSHINSDHVQKIFRDPYVQSLMDSEVLNGPFVSIEPCANNAINFPKLHVAFNFQVTSSLEYVYGVLSNINDCTWVQGCLKAEPIDSNHRKLHLSSNIILHETIPLSSINAERTNMSYSYQIDSAFPASGSGTVNLAFKDYVAKLSVVTNVNSKPNYPIVDVTYASEFNALDPRNPQARAAASDSVKQDFLKNRIPFLQQLFKGHGKTSAK